MAFDRFLSSAKSRYAYTFTEVSGGRSYVVKRYVQGRCYAIRFAPGHTLEMICANLAGRRYSLCDWTPYNESTGEFSA